MLNKIKFHLHSGEEYADNVTDKRKVINLNIIALITIISFTVYSFIYFLLASRNIVWFNSGIIILLFFPVSILSYILNKNGKFRLARWLISTDFILVILSLMLFGQGNYFNAHFFFLAFCSAVFTYFPLSQWRDIVFFFIINLTLFTLSHIGIFQPYPEAYLADPIISSFFNIVNIAVSTLILGGMIFLSEYETFTSDKKLEALSTTDSLTKLLNRYGFISRFEEELVRCQRYDNYGALLFFDLNDFKSINDKFGHNIGDLLLQEVAHRIQSSLRKTDVVARIGGDEFIALMCQTGKNKTDTLNQAEATVKIIYELLEKEYSFDQNTNISKVKEYTCSASIGISIFNGDSKLDDVLKEADQEMYKKKHQR